MAASAGLALYPRGERVGYPLAQKVASPRVAGPDGSALWKLEPESLEELTKDDAARLGQAMDELDRGLAFLEAEKGLLTKERPDDLGMAERERVRAIWWGLLEPLLALDELKHRYAGWYGVSYKAYPGLHARAYALSFAALCAQVEAGQSLVDAVAGKALAQTLFDEAMPEYGLPGGTFRALRRRLSRSRDYSLVPLGAEWLTEWIRPHLRDGTTGERIAGLVDRKLPRAERATRLANADATLKNKLETLKGEAFARWFPVQKGVAEWFGDTRVAPENRRLVSDAQLADMKKALRPGDVIVERRNWYLSNVGLPGFWPHAALYVGTKEELEALGADPAVTAKYGSFTEHLEKKHRAAFTSLLEKDEAGHPRSVLEAVSEGVVFQSLEHSCGADYVAALRPKMAAVDVAAAIDRAFGFFGRPYDFNFDFATDDAIVCSELVLKAYEPSEDQAPGLRIPFVTVAGRRAVPPTEFVRAFAKERGSATPQLGFVYFLDGREKTKSAVIATEADLAGSVDRPKWDIAQP